MHAKRITQKNLELLINELEVPLNDEDIGGKLYYDHETWAVLRQKNGFKKSRIDVTKRSPEFSLVDVLGDIPYKKTMQLPKGEGVEDVLSTLDFKKSGEDEGHEVYTLDTGGLRERLRNVSLHELKKQYQDYLRLWKEEPEYGLYETMNILSNASSGALLGAIMPSFWDYGGMMELAGTMISIQKIGTPLTNVFTSSSLGKMVDRFDREADLDTLKNLQKKVGTLHTFLAADTFLMQKDFIAATPAPEPILLGLYGVQTIGATAGRMALESKTHYSIRDYLIRRNPALDVEDTQKFYQLIGSGHALAHLGYASAFAASWLTCKSNPALILPIAAVSGLAVIATKFAWAYTRSIKDPIHVTASDYVIGKEGYSFDTGWKVPTAEPLVGKMRGYEISAEDGLTLISDTPVRVEDTKKGCRLINERGSITLGSRKHDCREVGEGVYRITST